MITMVTVFDIFDFEKYCYLIIPDRGYRGCSKSLKLVPFDSLPVVSY